MTMPSLLFPFQVKGAKFLSARKVALLADEMGLGKSAQLIAAADDILAKRILILCPAVARLNWAREWKKFSVLGRKVQVILKGKDEPDPTAEVIVCSYDLAVALHKEGKFNAMTFDVLGLDEGHFLKSPKAQRTKAVMAKTGIIRRAKRVWVLTGTPMPNHPGELWTLLRVFGVTKTPYYEFVMQYCEMPRGWTIGDPLQIVGAKRSAIPRLRYLLSRFMLRRLKKDVIDLPPLLFTDVAVPPNPIPKALFPVDYDEEIANHDLALMLESPSVATIRRLNGLRKIDAVVQLLTEELERGDYKKVIVFAIHRDVIEALRKGLQQFQPVVITGETPMAARQKAVDDFQTNARVKVFLGNIRAAGTAITLTSAHQVVFVEQEWTPGDNAQAAMRAHRIGQTQSVLVRCIGIADSIDEKISAILRRKTEDIVRVLAQ